MRAWLLLFAFGCGPVCETACGLTSDTPLCAELRAQEERALGSFQESVTHWEIGWTCQRLSGFEVKVAENSDGSSFDLNGENVLGFTSCNNKEIVLANEDWATNAFTHELAHVIEGCLGPPIVPVFHYGWEGRLINAAVNNVTLAPTP